MNRVTQVSQRRRPQFTFPFSLKTISKFLERPPHKFSVKLQQIHTHTHTYICINAYAYLRIARGKCPEFGSGKSGGSGRILPWKSWSVCGAPRGRSGRRFGLSDPRGAPGAIAARCRLHHRTVGSASENLPCSWPRKALLVCVYASLGVCASVYASIYMYYVYKYTQKAIWVVQVKGNWWSKLDMGFLYILITTVYIYIVDLIWFARRRFPRGQGYSSELVSKSNNNENS